MGGPYRAATRPHERDHGHGHGHHGGGRGGSGPGWKARAFDREAFKRAAFRFGVWGGLAGDDGAPSSYAGVLSSPDAALEWSDVAVCYLDGDAHGMTCPICLSTAVASLITACGHSFCAACIHRHLASHADAWEGHSGRPPRCPLCMGVMSPDELVACVHSHVKKLAVGGGGGPKGGVVDLVLRCRRKGSAVSYPASAVKAVPAGPRLESCKEVEMVERPFRTVLLCDDLRREWGAKALTDLERATAEAAMEGMDLAWLMVAADDVNRRLREFDARRGSTDAQVRLPSPVVTSGEPGSQGIHGLDDMHATMHESTFTPVPSGPQSPPAPKDGLGLAMMGLGVAPAAYGDADTYFFYQVADGQRVFLHPLNHRQLLTQVGGNASALPWRISARLVDLESHTCSESERRRLPFLGHLPLTASYQLAELAMDSLRATPSPQGSQEGAMPHMQPWRLSDEALAMNSGEISRRAKQRRKARYVGQQQQAEPKGEAALEALFGREHLDQLRARVLAEAPDMAAEPTALAAYGRERQDAEAPAAIDAWRARQEAEAAKDARNSGPKSGPLQSFAAIADRGFAAGLARDSPSAFPALGGMASGSPPQARSLPSSSSRMGGGWGGLGGLAGTSPPAWGTSAAPASVTPTPAQPSPSRPGTGKHAKKKGVLLWSSSSR